jgi:uncharacterized membrane protein
MRARSRWAALIVPLLIACVLLPAFAQPPAPRDSARVQAPYKMPPLGKALADDLHNKLIHFPIVLTMVAAAMLIVARRRREVEPVAFWLVWAAALSVIPAYFTGKAQAEHFHGRPKEWLVGIHEKQGIAIGILQAFWVLSLLTTTTRRWAWLLGIVLVVMVVAAGFIGGLVAHGH